MAVSDLKQKAKTGIDNVIYYWSQPPKGRFMNFKEILSYSLGGIGAYFLIAMGNALLVSTTNMIVGSAIGVAAMDMYYIYIIAVLAEIPLTGLRAQIVDNTRSKAGKYRPYLISMGIPTAIIAVGYVWFPYEKLDTVFSGQMLGHDTSYIAMCAVVLIFNLLLKFFFNFFNDAYTNLIHVLSPNTQERSDVLAVKSVVYSLAPSIMNIVLPLIAQFAANDNLYDIKVYRIGYPVFAILGMGLTIIVFANTKEKIVQAKTHTIQISFVDSFKAVAKNKYFWIIALAGWVGFLESAYGNILSWSYTYGHTCNGTQYALINTLTGNASLWGMLLAPLCIRKWGKKNVLIMTNIVNILCIGAMMFDMENIWWLFICVYFNWLVSAFAQILSPAIQADIRDYQQYRTGERIDGMFATVLTVGNLVTLLTSSVLPAVQEHYGIYDGNGYSTAYAILDTQTGQPGLLYTLMRVLIILAMAGAFLNVVPYFFYDFTEKKQKSVIRVLQVRSLFEDYGNNALGNRQIVEAIDLINNARVMADESPREATKDSYKNISDKSAKKAAKAEYRQALQFNEEIDISKFVCAELDKFDSDLYKHELKVYTDIYNAGLDGIKKIDRAALKAELKDAKKLPKNTDDEKQFRQFEIEIAKNMRSAKKYYDKYYGSINAFVEPDMAVLTALFDKEDECDAKIFELHQDEKIAKAEENKEKIASIKAEIKKITEYKKQVQKESKAVMDDFARFNRAARPYNDAKKLLKQSENYKSFDKIAALYDEAKEKADEEDRIKEEKAAAKRAEQEAELARRKAQKQAKKQSKK
ncbi:MAG: MFS transporter [Clostridiales bacterium]|nr:MFS transporter [Clostridiales bacterium]